MENPEQTLRTMLKYKSLPQHIESVFIHNILKVFAHVMKELEEAQKYDAILQLCDAILAKLSESVKSGELEVQERASTVMVIINIVKEEISNSKYKPDVNNNFKNFKKNK